MKLTRKEEEKDKFEVLIPPKSELETMGEKLLKYMFGTKTKEVSDIFIGPSSPCSG